MKDPNYTYVLAVDLALPVRSMTWAEFVKQYPVVRCPEWALTRAELASLQGPRSVIQPKGKKGRAA